MNQTIKTNHRPSQKQAYLDWLLQAADSYTHAATLTLKPYRTVLTPKGRFVISISPIEAQHNFVLFLKRLNSSMFGNAAKRYGKSVTVLPVLEGDGKIQLLHYHCAMGNFPAQLPTRAIDAKIISAWHQTPFGNECTGSG
jgi:hypothetical protein